MIFDKYVAISQQRHNIDAQFLRKSNRNSYPLYHILPMTSSDLIHRRLSLFLTFGSSFIYLERLKLEYSNVVHMYAISSISIKMTNNPQMGVNGPVVHPKNFKRLCMGGQSTPMFIIKYSRQLVADCYNSFTLFYSNSS